MPEFTPPALSTDTATAAQLALLSLAVQGLLLMVCLMPGMPHPLTTALVAHGVYTALLALGVWRCTGDCRLPLLHVLVVGSTGPVGAGVFAVVAALLIVRGGGTRSARQAAETAAWFAALAHSGTEEDTPLQRTHERIVYRLDDTATTDGLQPYAEILAGRDLFAKQRVLGRIAHLYRPEFAPLLRAALADRDPAVRVLAATTRATLERRFVQRIIAAEALHHAQPENALLRHTLADACQQYAASGLPDVMSARTYAAKAAALRAGEGTV